METSSGPDLGEMTNPRAYNSILSEERGRIRDSEVAFIGAFHACCPLTLWKFRCYAAILCIGLFDDLGSHLCSSIFQSLKDWAPRLSTDDNCWQELHSKAIFADKPAMQLRAQTIALLWTLLCNSGSHIKLDSQYQKPSASFSPLQNLSLYNEVFGLPNSATIAFDPEKVTNLIQLYRLGFDESPDMRQVVDLGASHLATSLPIKILLDDFEGEKRILFPAKDVILEKASIQDGDFVRCFIRFNERKGQIMNRQQCYLSCFLIACNMILRKNMGMQEGLQNWVSSPEGQEFRCRLLVSLKASSKPEELALIVAGLVSLNSLNPSSTVVAPVGLVDFCYLLDRQQSVDIDRAVLWHAAFSLIRAIDFVFEYNTTEPDLGFLFDVVDTNDQWSLRRSNDRLMEHYWNQRLTDGSSHNDAMKRTRREMASVLLTGKALNIQDKPADRSSSVDSLIPLMFKLDPYNPHHEDGSGASFSSRAKQTRPYMYHGAISSTNDAWILITALHAGLLSQESDLEHEDEGWSHVMTLICKYNAETGFGEVQRTSKLGHEKLRIEEVQRTSESGYEMRKVNLLTEHGVYRVISFVGHEALERRPSEDPRMFLAHLQTNLNQSPMVSANFRRLALIIGIGIINDCDTPLYVNLLDRVEADWIPQCPYDISHWEELCKLQEFDGLSACQLRDRTMMLLSQIKHAATGHPTQHDKQSGQIFTSHQDLTLLKIAFKLDISAPVSLLKIDAKRLAVDLKDNSIYDIRGTQDLLGHIRMANQILPIFRGRDWLELPTSLQEILDQSSEEKFIVFITGYHRLYPSFNGRENDELFLFMYLYRHHMADPRLKVWIESIGFHQVHNRILDRLRHARRVVELTLCLVELYAIHRLQNRMTKVVGHHCHNWLVDWNEYILQPSSNEDHYDTVGCAFSSFARVIPYLVRSGDPVLSLIQSELTDGEERLHWSLNTIPDTYFHKRISFNMNHQRAMIYLHKATNESHEQLQVLCGKINNAWEIIEQAEEA